MSSSRELDLGCADLVSTTSGLSLKLSSLVRVVAPADGDFDSKPPLTAVPKPNGRLLDQWISRADSYRLVLDLDIDRDIGLGNEDQLSATLADRLEKAKVKGERSPAGSSAHKRTDMAAATPASVSLNHDEVDMPDLKRQRHKIGAGVPCHDLSPPDGAACLKLETAHLTMSISMTKPRKRIKLTPSIYVATDEIVEHDQIELLIDEEDSMSEEELLDLDLCGVPTEFPPYIFTPSDIDDDDLFQSAGFHGQEVEDMTMYDADKDLTSAYQYVQRPPSYQNRTSGQTHKKDVEVGTQTHESIFNLIDAALRLAISEAPRRLPKSVRIRGDAKVRGLADLAPMLWSPDYLLNTWARAVFMPTICHALVNIGTNQVMRASLKSKLDDLCRDSSTSTNETARPRNHSKAVAIRLWHFLQDSCHDRNAARSLKPLFDDSVDHKAHSPDLFDSLDATQESMPDSMVDFLDDADAHFSDDETELVLDHACLTDDFAEELSDLCDEEMGDEETDDGRLWSLFHHGASEEHLNPVLREDMNIGDDQLSVRVNRPRLSRTTSAEHAQSRAASFPESLYSHLRSESDDELLPI